MKLWHSATPDVQILRQSSIEGTTSDVQINKFILREINGLDLFVVSSAYNQKNCLFASFNGLSSLYTVVATLSAMHVKSTANHCKLISNPTMTDIALLQTESTMGVVNESHQNDNLEHDLSFQSTFVCLIY